jgi:hypothetical protein
VSHPGGSPQNRNPCVRNGPILGGLRAPRRTFEFWRDLKPRATDPKSVLSLRRYVRRHEARRVVRDLDRRSGRRADTRDLQNSRAALVGGPLCSVSAQPSGVARQPLLGDTLAGITRCHASVPRQPSAAARSPQLGPSWLLDCSRPTPARFVADRKPSTLRPLARRSRMPAALPGVALDAPRDPAATGASSAKFHQHPTSKTHKPEPDQHKKARRRSDEEPPLYDVHGPSLHVRLTRGRSCAADSVAVYIKR